MQYESFPIQFSMYDPGIDKDAWIEDIIDYVRHMDRNDDILVYDYGKNGNLKLIVSMDDDTDIRIFVDMWVHPDDPDDGMVCEVDETDWFYKNELIGIRNELRRIWDEDYVID